MGGTCQTNVEPLDFPADEWESWKAAHVYSVKSRIEWEVATFDASPWGEAVAHWDSQVATYGTGIDWFTCATLCARVNTKKNGQKCAQIKYHEGKQFCFLMPTIDHSRECTDDPGWVYHRIEWYGPGGGPDANCDGN